MPRQPRIELEGALYHIISRGNNRQVIFKDDQDRAKFLSLLEGQKKRRPFYLYAYVLMSNHVHLLVERAGERLGDILKPVFGSYAQWWNRKYRHVGHVFQSRYKAILCQSDAYLGTLVRYIHLNPVRAKIVRHAEEYQWSSHRVYLRQRREPWVDVEPVLRQFGKTKKQAIAQYVAFVRAGEGEGHREDFYQGVEGRMLGDAEFVETIKKKVGDVKPMGKRQERTQPGLTWQDLVERVERETGVKKQAIFGRGRKPEQLLCKEALIYAAHEWLGMRTIEIARRMGVDPSSCSRRYAVARERVRSDASLRHLVERLTS
jgi:REP element-mobilizing transposase RayT